MISPNFRKRGAGAGNLGAAAAILPWAVNGEAAPSEALARHILGDVVPALVRGFWVV